MNRVERKELKEGMEWLNEFKDGNVIGPAVERVQVLKDKARSSYEKGVGHAILTAMTATIGVCAANGVFHGTDPVWRQIGVSMCLILGTIEAALAHNNFQKGVENSDAAYEEYKETMKSL